MVEQRAFAELSQTVQAKLPEWSAAAEQQVAEARAELTQALDEFLAPRLAALTEALAVRRFVTGSDSGRYRVPGAQVELPRSSETRVQADDVISALRQLGHEPNQRPGTPYSGSMRVAGVR